MFGYYCRSVILKSNNINKNYKLAFRMYSTPSFINNAYKTDTIDQESKKFPAFADVINLQNGGSNVYQEIKRSKNFQECTK